MANNPRLTAKESKLFAILMRDEWCDRVVAFDPAHSDDDYYAFLRANRVHGDALCPYGAALRLIES